MSEAKLKPCPFCGGGGLSFDNPGERNGRGVMWVLCNHCHCEGPYAYSRAETIEAWNRRAALSEIEPSEGDK